MNAALSREYQEVSAAEKYVTSGVGFGGRVGAGRADGLLLPFMSAATANEADEQLARLVLEYARPVAASVLKSKLRVSLGAADGRRENQDALELGCEIQADLIAALQRARSEQKSIGCFRDYVAVVAYNACHKYLRRKYPRRHSLKNRLRYLLTHSSGFSIWETGGATLCGQTGWRFQKRPRVTGGLMRRLPDPSRGCQHDGHAGRDLRTLPLTELVPELFRLAGGPVELDELITVVAGLQGIKDEEPKEQEVVDEPGRTGFDGVAAAGRWGHALDLERRLYLEQLWSEICQLPPRQRAALLLNLRDSSGGGVMGLFPVTGVASLRQMAAALGMSAEEFAGLWNALPLDDAAIGERLCATRQQVINLRKCARERLARRMKVSWQTTTRA